MPEPVVSVHMLTFNHAPFIREAIDSVLAQQTDFVFEIVIGEDCSTDGTREIVAGYAERYPGLIRLITSEANVGMRLNSLRTTDACRGRYVAWCEGDDFWHRTDKLQRQFDAIEADTQIALVHSDHDRLFHELGMLVPDFFRSTGNEPPADFSPNMGWGGFHVLTCTAMARLDLVKEITRDPELYRHDQFVGADDVPLFTELALQSGVAYIAESLSTYRVRADSASNPSDPVDAARFVQANNEAKLYLARKYQLHGEVPALERRVLRTRLWSAFHSRDGSAARTAWLACPDHAPMDWLLYAGATREWLGRLLNRPLRRYQALRSRPPRAWFRHAVPVDMAPR